MVLAGASAIVTGGAVRIGRAIGLRLAQAGVHVCVHFGKSETEALAAVEEFRSCGVRATLISADLNDPFVAADRVFLHAAQELGRITILVNCAAIFESGTCQTTTGENWDRHLNINLKAPFAFTQSLVLQLDGSPGAVINLVDWRGSRPVPGHLAYTIAKAGLVAQTKLLAQELGPQVRVNGVAPGAILPAPGESQTDFENKSELNPLQATGCPEDLAEAVMYLLSARFVTGEIINVTGGQQLGVTVQP